MGKVIAVCSGKGGTGKTSSTAALSAALARRGRRVLATDCDVGLRNLDLCLGISEEAVFNFCDVLEGRVSLQDAAVEHPEVPGLFLLTAPSLRRPEDIDPRWMMRLMDDARQQFDYVLADAPAGIGAGFRLALAGADEAVVVANPDAASLRDAQRVAWEIRESAHIPARLLVNRLRRSILRIGRSSVDAIMDEVGLQLLGIIREDRNVILAANAGIPLAQYRRPKKRSAARQFDRVAARLEGEYVPLGPV